MQPNVVQNMVTLFTSFIMIPAAFRTCISLARPLVDKNTILVNQNKSGANYQLVVNRRNHNSVGGVPSEASAHSMAKVSIGKSKGSWKSVLSKGSWKSVKSFGSSKSSQASRRSSRRSRISSTER